MELVKGALFASAGVVMGLVTGFAAALPVRPAAAEFMSPLRQDRCYLVDAAPGLIWTHCRCPSRGDQMQRTFTGQCLGFGGPSEMPLWRRDRIPFSGRGSVPWKVQAGQGN